ncbi:MAG: transaldolase family protein [bacterium]|nr:transaldolase family protein [bacterium]
MELYLDSANLKEIEGAFKLGILDGLTTTPTFMQREGVMDVDGTIKKLSKIVPILQIEALGETAEEITKETHRLLKLGLNPKKTVFKIPVSLEGIRACKMLNEEGLMVNIHLVYTLQQAYMAMHAGATYVCPLVGRLQDQGHDALDLVEKCVKAIKEYSYKTKVMFSSVRHIEHVRNAVTLGVHAITVPYKILVSLTENNFTTVGIQQFVRDTKLTTTKVGDLIRKTNPLVSAETKLIDALIKMTNYGFGAITVINKNGSVRGIFTDGDLRRQLSLKDKNILLKSLDKFDYKPLISVEYDDLLGVAVQLFKETKVDTILVTKKGKPVGMLDIQDMESY